MIAPQRIGVGAKQLRHRRQLVFRRDQLPPHIARSRQRKQKRVRTSIYQVNLHRAPVFVGVIVQKSPALQDATLATLGQHQAIGHAPQRRLRDVAQRHRSAFAGQQAQQALRLTSALRSGVERGLQAGRKGRVERPYCRQLRRRDAVQLARAAQQQQDLLIAKSGCRRAALALAVTIAVTVGLVLAFGRRTGLGHRQYIDQPSR